MMQIISVNVAKPTPIANAKQVGVTGIYKQPQSAPVNIHALGLDGDTICDVENHGGVDQAVYLFGQCDYDWWSRELNTVLAAGTFGENLTISAMESMAFKVGDYVRVGDSSRGGVCLQITSPRIPCVTLAVRMNDPAFVKKFRQAARPGLYCRVITTGSVQIGDPVTVEPYTGSTLSIAEFFELAFKRSLDAGTLRRLLAAPIDVRSRRHYSELLMALEA